MEFEPTAIPEVVLIRPKVFGDPRGYFFESWEERKFAAAGLDVKFVQDFTFFIYLLLSSIHRVFQSVSLKPVG